MRTLLRTLAEAGPRGLSAEALIDAIWADDPPEHPSKALQVLVSRTRTQTTAEAIERTTTGYRLALQTADIDLWALDILTTDAEAALTVGDIPRALELARTAIDLGEDSRAVRVIAVATAKQGRHREALPELTRLHEANPFDEKLTAEFLRALAGAKGTPAALQAYADVQTRLAEDLGSSSGPALQAVHQELLAMDEPVRSGVRYAATSLLGRDDDLEQVTGLLSSARLVTIVGPGGLGKTTAMSALRRAWEKEHGSGSVVGLAPSAVAAQVLADDLGIRCENTAKWWQNHLIHGTDFEAGQLVIIDEASLAGTLSLDRITHLAERVGAKALLVGDYGQLQSVDAGGAFGLLVGDRNEAPELVDVHRFTHEWEKTASLALRHGRTQVIDTYLDHHRIHEGEAEAMTDAAYTAWPADRNEGLVSVLIAETRDDVSVLNQRARADLILDGTLKPGREVELNDGTTAGVGDTIITRRNDRRLRNAKDWVRNGDTWTIKDVRDDGSITVRPTGRRFGGSIILPAPYVAEHVDLG